MRNSILPLVVCCLTLCGNARAERLLLDFGQHALFWSKNTGAEFPGATVRLDAIDDEQQGRCVRASCRYAGESHYAGLEWRGTVAQATAIGFWCRLSDQDSGIVRVVDSTGQSLSAGFKAKRGQWVQVQVPLSVARFSAHWGGANDGQFHFPLQKVLIAVNRKPDAQEVRVCKLYAQTDSVAPRDAWQLVVEPGVSCGVALEGEEVCYRLHVMHRIERPAQARVTLMSQALEGRASEAGSWSFPTAGWEHFVREIRLPSNQPGYRRLSAELREESGGSDGGKEPMVRAISALGVVPRPRAYGRWAPRGYFGLQSIPDMEAAERLGAKAVREFVFWRYSEPQAGRIRWDGDFLDGAVAATEKHRMQLMFTVVLAPPDWAAWKHPDHPKASELPDPARVQDFARLVREIAARYRGKEHLTTIEIENEPDLTCMDNAGFKREEAADYFAIFLRAGSAAAREGNPRIQVASLSISNVDFDRGFPFTKAVLGRAADSLDLFTGHVYASPREFGPGKQPKWPLQNQMAVKCRAALDLMAAHARPRRMWIGELGWPVLNTADPLGSHAMDVAACTAQSLVVGKSVPGVERYIQFTLQGCNEKGYEYGLVRGDPAYPLPTALAYASAAQALDDAEPVELFEAAPKLWRASFACPSRNELVIAWWSEDQAIGIHLPDAAPAGRWMTSFFQSLPPRSRVSVGRLPLYWTLPLDKVGRQPAFLREVKGAGVVILTETEGKGSFRG